VYMNFIKTDTLEARPPSLPTGMDVSTHCQDSVFDWDCNLISI
jgi:hypothetical protein